MTATPERSDGGDLLALCQQNLVYRCDLVEGVREGLLAPFHYFGVPDDVDYTNIPWRSTRFDEEALTTAVATQRRAENALEQFRTKGGTRALGFCVSQRHADFMAAFFKDQGLRAVAVHSGPTSAPRAASLEQLEAGELDIVFAVDMFNEGVDLPTLDTVMMLRPTESKILWLQQFGRGLAEGAPARNDSRSSTTSATTGCSCSSRRRCSGSDPATARSSTCSSACEPALRSCRLVARSRTSWRPSRSSRACCGAARDRTMRLERYYQDFKTLHGIRPTATEVYEDGYNPRAVRERAGSWIRFVASMGDLDATQQRALERHGAFIDALDTTEMVKSYKMLVLLAMLNADRFPGSIGIDELADQVERLATRTTRAGSRPGIGAQRPEGADPAARAESRSPRGREAKARRASRTSLSRRGVSDDVHRRAGLGASASGAGPRAGRVAAHRVPRSRPDADGRILDAEGESCERKPILFLPSEPERSDLPKAGPTCCVDGQRYSANFVKVAINVVRKPRGRGEPAAEDSPSAGSVPTPARPAHGTRSRLN